ncbi:hypothetical protein F1737_11405 [Methanoplanus sp. FWC-SCC4]|uniref:Uncharacterized protein n=1 Tax=Methanochimaera problematica TaxID=2609417 RepID=A0AA97FFA4_9EURY|nr:hypothetical protein [Methanoplanus sp. FWC-SCC4]WOF17238.1 hypothetical protein F1737_11405 [Methanoplanus sp. FWC-SCC4]
MKNNYKILLAATVIISLGLFLVSYYLTAIGLIISGTLAMVFVMNEHGKTVLNKPRLFPILGDDGRSVIITNTGETDALSVEITIVPSNLEYSFKSIDADSEIKIETKELVGKNKINIEYYDKSGEKFTVKENLTFAEDTEYDPFKPMIPMFK